jgi:hypothetical protein
LAIGDAGVVAVGRATKTEAAVGRLGRQPVRRAAGTATADALKPLADRGAALRCPAAGVDDVACRARAIGAVVASLI